MKIQNRVQESILNTIDNSLENDRTIADDVFDVLREQIVTGELRPNQRLVESEIAKNLGISRTPVREALKRLKVTGYANVLRDGLIVTEHSIEQVRNIYEIREALEMKAMRLVCQRITDEQINRAEEYFNHSVEAVSSHDIDKYLGFHNSFHGELYVSCGNERLLFLIRTFRDQYFIRRLARVFTSRDWRTQITHHGRILKATRDRNERLAEKAVQRMLIDDLRVALKRL